MDIDKANNFHALAKDAGNKLKHYILTYSAASLGVFFLVLSRHESDFSALEKVLILSSLVFFLFTVLLCFFELHMDARRFFNLAKQHETETPDWSQNNPLKKLRLRVIFASYITGLLALLLAAAFLSIKILE